VPTEINPALTDEEAAVEARRIITEFATNYRDHAPVPAVGSALPVPQPGRPPMSQRATDASALMLSGSVFTVALGGSATAVLWASGHADPAVVATVFGAPAFLVLALARLMRRAKDAAPDVTINNYNGTVHQQTTHSSTRGVWAKTNHRH
jgi:hypothetical protein